MFILLGMMIRTVVVSFCIIVVIIVDADVDGGTFIADCVVGPAA